VPWNDRAQLSALEQSQNPSSQSPDTQSEFEEQAWPKATLFVVKAVWDIPKETKKKKMITIKFRIVFFFIIPLLLKIAQIIQV